MFRSKYWMQNLKHLPKKTEENWKILLRNADFKNIRVVGFFPSSAYFLVELLNISAKFDKDWHFWGTFNNQTGLSII